MNSYSDRQPDRTDHHGCWLSPAQLALGPSFLLRPHILHVFGETFLQGDGTSLEARFLIKEPTKKKQRWSQVGAAGFDLSNMKEAET